MTYGTVELDIDGDGEDDEVPCFNVCGVEPPGCSAPTAPMGAPTTAGVTACAEVIYPDPSVPCQQACEELEPALTCGTTVGPGSGYVGAGLCVHGADDTRYVNPFVPLEARRQGILVPSDSTFQFEIEGIGEFDTLVPDVGWIWVQGGACSPARTRCPFVITQMEVGLDTESTEGSPVAIGEGYEADFVQIFLNQATLFEDGAGEARPAAFVDNLTALAPPDTWAMDLTPTAFDPADQTHPLRVNIFAGDVQGSLFSGDVSGSFAWENVTETASFSETSPGGLISLRPDSTDKFIVISGTMDAVVDVDPSEEAEDLRDAQLTLSLRFEFFSGAAFLDVEAAMFDGDPDYVILDGSSAIDPLGTPGSLTYSWRTRGADSALYNDSIMHPLGDGAVIAVPRVLLQYMLSSGGATHVCLEVTDIDGDSDEQCFAPKLGATPTGPSPQQRAPCGTVATGAAAGPLFREMIGRAGLAESLDSLDAGTLFLPTDAALEEHYGAAWIRNVATTSEITAIVLDHLILSSTMHHDDLESLPPQFMQAASGRSVLVGPATAGDIMYADIDCGEAAVVHAVRTTLTPH